LHRRGKPRGCRIDLGEGTEYSECGQAALVSEEEVEGRQAGLHGQAVRGGEHKTVGSPSLDLVPEYGQLPGHVNGGQENISAIAEDGEEERGGQSMTEERREADPWGRESLDRHEGCLSFRQSLDEVGGSGDRGGEPITQPSNLVPGHEDRTVKVDRSIGDGVPIPGRTPVDELCFGDRETNA